MKKIAITCLPSERRQHLHLINKEWPEFFHEMDYFPVAIPFNLEKDIIDSFIKELDIEAVFIVNRWIGKITEYLRDPTFESESPRRKRFEANMKLIEYGIENNLQFLE